MDLSYSAEEAGYGERYEDVEEPAAAAAASDSEASAKSRKVRFHSVDDLSLMQSGSGSRDNAAQSLNVGARFPTGDALRARYTSKDARRRQTQSDLEEEGIEYVDEEGEPVGYSSRGRSGRVGFHAPETLEEKKEQMNALFGIMPWKTSVTEKALEQHSETVKKLYMEPAVSVRDYGSFQEAEKEKKKLSARIGDGFYVVLVGWWLALLYLFVGVLLWITIVGRHYGSMSFRLAGFYLWPFGKFVVLENESVGMGGYDEGTSLLSEDKLGGGGGGGGDGDAPINGEDERADGEARKCSCGRALWLLFGGVFCLWGHVLAFILCWMLVITIPMAKVNRIAMSLLFRRDVRKVKIVTTYPGPGADVIMCTFQAVNVFYYKYSVWGMNVVLVNLLPFVVLALFFAYFPYLVPALKLPDGLMFTLCLFSVIPLSYFIGLALSSLSAQTSFAVGAVLNATFGSIIELILYFSAILEGGLNSLVQAGATGTLLGMMLFLPGLAMVAGGMKNKEQRFNPASAGVSGVLLLISVVGAFTPTMFYQIYGNYQLTCTQCAVEGGDSFSSYAYDCASCAWGEGNLDEDSIYTDNARPLMYTCAAILPVSYIVGLWFTLRTHAYIVDNPEYINLAAAAAHGPMGPKWSKIKCIVILLVATTMFALLAEEMVNTLTPTLDTIGLSQTFAGLTIIALIPNTAEFVNAIQFALHDNFSMSLEIANSAAVQVSLIQMPALVFFSAILNRSAAESFTLIFPSLDLVAVFFSVIIMNYISIDGRSNYFLGVSLLIVYTLFAAAFFFAPVP